METNISDMAPFHCTVRPCVYLIDGGGAKLDAQGGPGKGSPGILILAVMG